MDALVDLKHFLKPFYISSKKQKSYKIGVGSLSHRGNAVIKYYYWHSIFSVRLSVEAETQAKS